MEVESTQDTLYGFGWGTVGNPRFLTVLVDMALTQLPLSKITLQTFSPILMKVCRILVLRQSSWVLVWVRIHLTTPKRSWSTRVSSPSYSLAKLSSAWYISSSKSSKGSWGLDSPSPNSPMCKARFGQLLVKWPTFWHLKHAFGFGVLWTSGNFPLSFLQVSDVFGLGWLNLVWFGPNSWPGVLVLGA